MLLGEAAADQYRRLVDLDSAHVVVTGGAAGIGAAAARAFARAGARGVVVADLDGDATAAVAAEFGGGDFAWAADESERRRLWRARHVAMEATRAMRAGAAALTTDVCVPISALAQCIAETQADIAEHALTASIVGHVGDGNFHVILLVDPTDAADIERGEAFHTRLVRRALAHDGTSTGEHGVGYGKARFLVEEHGEPAVEMMRAIKSALDPDGIFNPGKTVTAI